jgi:hypothetical protein
MFCCVIGLLNPEEEGTDIDQNIGNYSVARGPGVA